MIYLLIDSNNVVENVIVLENVEAFVVPEGYTLEPQSGSVWIGWKRVDSVWQPPE